MICASEPRGMTTALSARRQSVLQGLFLGVLRAGIRGTNLTGRFTGSCVFPGTVGALRDAPGDNAGHSAAGPLLT
jgi:hypothetical protein